MELDFISGQYSLYHLEHFFCYMMEDIQLPLDVRHRVRLCFQEVVTNAVKHGNQYDENKKVFIRRVYENHKLVFYIQDEGTGFDFNHIDNPLDEKNIEKQNGRGVFLVKQLSCHSEYNMMTKTMKLEFNIMPHL